MSKKTSDKPKFLTLFLDYWKTKRYGGSYEVRDDREYVLRVGSQYFERVDRLLRPDEYRAFFDHLTFGLPKFIEPHEIEFVVRAFKEPKQTVSATTSIDNTPLTPDEQKWQELNARFCNRFAMMIIRKEVPGAIGKETFIRERSKFMVDEGYTPEWIDRVQGQIECKLGKENHGE